MKKLLITALILASSMSFAQTKMGPEAVEMFNVLTHRSVVECLEKEDVKMVNVEIKKLVARCPGCNTYTITGNKRNIDTPSPEKTVITIKGRRATGAFGLPTQTYTCSVEN